MQIFCFAKSFAWPKNRPSQYLNLPFLQFCVLIASNDLAFYARFSKVPEFSRLSILIINQVRGLEGLQHVQNLISINLISNLISYFDNSSLLYNFNFVAYSLLIYFLSFSFKTFSAFHGSFVAFSNKAFLFFWINVNLEMYLEFTYN